MFLKIVCHAAWGKIDWLARGKPWCLRCDWVEDAAQRPIKRCWWSLGGYGYAPLQLCQLSARISRTMIRMTMSAFGQ